MKKTIITVLLIMIACTTVFAAEIGVSESVRLGYGARRPESATSYYSRRIDVFELEVGTEFQFYRSKAISFGTEISIGMCVGEEAVITNGTKTTNSYMDVNLFIAPIVRLFFSEKYSMSLAIGFDDISQFGTLGIEVGAEYDLNNKTGILLLARFGVVMNLYHYVIGLTHMY